MSSCLSGGGRAFSLGHEMMIKSPSSSWVSNSSSSPSFAADSSNSSVSISTRKARTPRKRPNQIYDEAAAILSSACPKIFPTKHLTKPRKNPIPFDSEELFVPLRTSGVSGYSLRSPIVNKRCRSPGEISSYGDNVDICDDLGEDFGQGSLVADCLEGRIDSIMGKLSMENECGDSFSSFYCESSGIGDGVRNESRAMRSGDDGEDDWWRFPTVDAIDVTQGIASKAPEEKKKKVARKNSSPRSNGNNAAKDGSFVRKYTSKKPPPRPNEGLHLKLSYDDVIDSWGDKASPFLGDRRRRPKGRFVKLSDAIGGDGSNRHD